MPDSQPDSQLADPVLDNAALLIRRFEQLAAEQPAASALEAGAESYTYAELNARANQFAHALLARGIGQGASVVLALPASVDCIAMLLAVCKTGAAYAPVGYDWPAARVRAVLARLDAALLVCESATAMHAALDHAVAIDDLRSSPDAMAKDPAVEVAPDDVCYVMHTSGTTGEPKGVLVTHGNLAGMYSASGIDWGLPGEAKWLWLHALAFGYSAWEIWGALAQGGCLVIVPEEARRDPLRWSELAAASHSTMLSLTPSALRQLAASGNQAGLAPHCVFLSGEALRHDDLPRLQQLFDFSTTSIFNLFALTETAGRVAVKQLTGNETPADSLIGQPAPDAELFVVEPESLAEAATGELLIAGPMLSPGYADDAVLTADRFVMHDPGDGVVRRCYRTGDRVRRTASGEFEFAGRIDAQIKLHGYRIEPADIEQTLRGHPGVADAAVTVRTEASGAEQLAAVVVRQAAAKPLEFWPSLGEHLLYDELLYDFMAADEVRIESYRAAFAGQVADQVVLDIGTGRHAVLARMCAAAGARKVYAVEVLEDAAREARELIAELGLSEQIEVICGDIQQIELPEKVSICTQGIVGNIGSSDGIVPLWNAARRWFSADLRAIPEQCETLFAPGELPQGNVENFAYPALAREYLDRLFKERGAEFDPRLCVRNFPKAQLLADASRFELLDFTAELNLAASAGLAAGLGAGSRSGCCAGSRRQNHRPLATGHARR
jgi:amino acid adenylation domain-containing protein